MTSAEGGGRGSPKRQMKGTKLAICVMGERGVSKKSENFADVIYGRPKGMAHEPLTNYFALKEHYSRPDRLNINVLLRQSNS